MSLTNNLAPTPPMGWNSYDYWGGEIPESKFIASVDVQARELLPFGWEYAVIDIAWMTRRPAEVDAEGRPYPNPKQFPSSSGGKGFKPLADHVHSKGMKFGIHVLHGIPKQAVEKKIRIPGTSVTADAIANYSEMNALSEDFYCINWNRPEGQAYYDNLLRQFEQWEVDFIKVDDVGAKYRKEDVEAIDQARQKIKRPIVLSLSAGCPQYSNYKLHRKQHCDTWRISEDFWDRWPQVEDQFFNLLTWQDQIGPGHWPDCDMLPFGVIGKEHEAGVNGPERKTLLTPHEQRTVMTLWCLAQSTLMFGGDLLQLDAETRALLTNPEVLAVNQHGRRPREFTRNCAESGVVWMSELPRTNGWAVGLFNFNAEIPRKISVALAEAPWAGPCRVRDLWARQDLGTFSKDLVFEIPPHGAGLYAVERA